MLSTTTPGSDPSHFTRRFDAARAELDAAEAAEASHRLVSIRGMLAKGVDPATAYTPAELAWIRDHLPRDAVVLPAEREWLDNLARSQP